jgi:hypothetical protein
MTFDTSIGYNFDSAVTFANLLFGVEGTWGYRFRATPSKPGAISRAAVRGSLGFAY